MRHGLERRQMSGQTNDIGQRSSTEIAAKFKAPCWREIKLKFLFKFSSILTFHVKILYVNNVCNSERKTEATGRSFRRRRLRNICKRVAWAFEQRSETNHSGHLKLKTKVKLNETAFFQHKVKFLRDAFLTNYHFISPMKIFWYQINMALGLAWPRLSACNNPVFDKYLLCICLPLFNLRLHSVG